MLGQFSGQEEPHRGLDLPRCNRRALVVMSQTRGLGGDTLENVIHERIHDRHGLGGDSSVRVDLLEDLVDVNSVGFLPPTLLLFVSLGYILLGLTGLLNSFAGNFRSHDGEVL